MPMQTSATVVYADPAAHFDPFRDSPASDIFLYHDTTDSKLRLSALLCGFNDLRSVAHTIGEAKRKCGDGHAAFNFVLNDMRPEPIARAMLILRALLCAKTESEALQQSHDVIALLFVNWLAVIPPQGRSDWITPALDVSYLHVPPPSTTFKSATERLLAKKLRERVKGAHAMYASSCDEPYPTIEWEGGASVIGEYLEFCHIAAVDRSVPAAIVATKEEPTPEVNGTVQALFFLTSALRRAILLPMFAI
ncbi:hypothetical protein H9P43_009053 [Blastocladiella emersonii ATCC 22665]|nr:hypothetical protein H9P43_009053 [Blastocladiella emersonii ATCC 22665]